MAFKCDKCEKEFYTKKEAEKHEKNCKGKICPNCGKKLSKLKIGMAYKKDGKRFCSIKCKNSYKNISEIKCKCNSCGQVWHYLPKEEKRAKSGKCWSVYGQITCCLPIQLYSKHQGLKWEGELDKFKKCPKCGSINITKKEIEHEVN